MIIKSILISESKATAVYESLKNSFPNIDVLILEKEATHLPKTDAFIGFGPVLDFNKQNYKWVHCLGAGVDRFINDGSLDHNTILTRTVNQFGYQIGSYCLSYMLNVENKVFEFLKLQNQKKWQRINKGTIQDKKVVIFGTGEIGSEIARILKFMEAQTIGVSKSGKKSAYFDEVYKITDSHFALKDANWVINILPLTNETNNIFNEEMFKNMKDVNFINVGRGKTVNEDDLLVALQKGNINYAILDVQTVEPLPMNSKLYNEDKIIITPHISGVPDFNQSAKSVVQILQKILSNEKLDCKVDFSKQY